MTNSMYTEKTISSVERILVDTSALMTSSFRQFIKNSKEYLTAYNKKLYISKGVYTELARHLGSSNKDKVNHAMAAVELISTNKELFEVDSVALTDTEIAKAFADAQLLSELTLNKSNCSQLLITNDKNLSSDAYKLNMQSSCKGGKILVCYINWIGEMQCCDCAKPIIPADATVIDEASEIVPVFTTEKSDCVLSSTSNNTIANKESHTETWTFDWKSRAIATFTVSAANFLFKNGSKILKYMNF